ncbi:MAG: HEAT repeat domain-containing protein [Phycisphaerales bacterium JB065]
MTYRITTAAALLTLAFLSTAGCAGSSSGSVGPTAVETSPLATPPRELSEYDQPLTQSTLRETALKILEDAAFDDSPLLRANAIESLQSVPHRAGPIVRAALTDSNAGVRFAALMSIGKLRLHETSRFIAPLLDDRDPRVRMAAIYALTRLDEPVDQNPLAEYLLTGESSVRSQAAFILGEIGNPSAIPLLHDTAMPPQKPVWDATNPPRAKARRIDQTIFRLQTAEALYKLGETDVRDVIHSALYPAAQDDMEAAVLAAQILGEIRDETAIRQLVELIEQPSPDSPDTDDPRRKVFLQPIELRLAAATALAKMGEVGGVYVADSALTSPNPAVRAQASFLYEAAARARDRSVHGRSARRLDLAKLESLMGDPNPMVRVAAASGLLHALESR